MAQMHIYKNKHLQCYCPGFKRMLRTRVSAVHHSRFMALRYNRSKNYYYFFFWHIREKNHLLWKKNIEIKAKDKTLMQYQKNFTRKLSSTKKRLESRNLDCTKSA